MIILTTQKKNHEKISTQSKAIVYWMGTVFSLKMPLFFLTILVSSHIATAPLDLGMKYLWFWGPQTYYYLNLRGQVNLWYSHFHQEQHMRQHCAWMDDVIHARIYSWRVMKVWLMVTCEKFLFQKVLSMLLFFSFLTR